MIFDGHADIWTDITNKMLNKGETDVFRKFHLNKFLEGRIGGGIFVIWTDPPHDVDPKKRVDQIVMCMNNEIAFAEDILHIVRTYDDVEAALESKKLMILIGMEGLSHIGSDVELLDQFYRLGARHASLTWNESNELATGALGDENRGLTAAGRTAVEKMESLGMLVDVSHLNEKSFWDVVATAKGPIIASHSNCRSLCDHRRNLTDDQLKAIAASGGLIGMNSFRDFVHADKQRQNVKGLVNHIDHLVDLVGIDHIAFGFDYCDFIEGDTLSSFSESGTPGIDGLNSAPETSNIIKELIYRGYKKEDIDKIAYGNYFRLLKKVLK